MSIACNHSADTVGRNAPCTFFGRTGVRMGSAMVPLDRALVSSCDKLSAVTMLLTEAVQPQFAMQVFACAVITSVWG